MPRPLNWIRGEGTYRNQRWGLEGLGNLTQMDINAAGGSDLLSSMYGDLLQSSGASYIPNPLGLTDNSPYLPISSLPFGMQLSTVNPLVWLALGGTALLLMVRNNEG